METEGQDGRAAGRGRDAPDNVVRLPRRWSGPEPEAERSEENPVSSSDSPGAGEREAEREPGGSLLEFLESAGELVPIGPSAGRAPKPGSPAAAAGDTDATLVRPEDFWSESFASLQTPVEAPRPHPASVDDPDAPAPDARVAGAPAGVVLAERHRHLAWRFVRAGLPAQVVVVAALAAVALGGGAGLVLRTLSATAPRGESDRGTAAAVFSATRLARDLPGAVVRIAQVPAAVAARASLPARPARPAVHHAARLHRTTGGSGAAPTETAVPASYRAPASGSTGAANQSTGSGGGSGGAGSAYSTHSTLSSSGGSASSPAASSPPAAGPTGPGAPFGPGHLG